MIERMSDLKTMPAALAELIRPRQMARIRRSVARSRAEGALFDAVLWSAFALLTVTVLLCAINFIDAPILARWSINEPWLLASWLVVAFFVAGALWWRWFKWHVHAADLTQRAPGSR